MAVPTKVFTVTGNKIASLVINDESLRFSSKSFNSIDEFNEAWDKKLSLATKVEVKLSKVKYVSKEEPGKEIRVRHKGWLDEAVFSFNNPEDYAEFFSYLEKDQYFTKTEETLSPIKAATPYILVLLFTIAMTIFCYYQALNVSDEAGLQHELNKASNGKARLFYEILSYLGDKGVIALGVAISAYILFRIWKRYTNPPNRVRYLPPNG